MDITGIGSGFDFAKGIIDRVWPKQADPNEKLKATHELAKQVEERDSKVVDAKKDIVLAELNQGDLYTKRARPTVVYGGLAIIGLNCVICPVLIDMMQVVLILGLGNLTPDQASQLSELGNYEIPAGFWAVWGSVLSIYSIGRSAEKKGISNKIVSFITGSGNKP